MSYIGGVQYSVDNRTDNELFSCIDRADMMEKIKADIMPMGYTGRIQANSSANYARNNYSQLHDGNINDRDISLYQYKGFKDDKIDASSRATQSASRFNYAYDRQVNKRYVDVSGQFIPNNKLRVLPNRSCSMYGTQPPPYDDPDLKQLSQSLMVDAINLTYNPTEADKYLKYKATRPKLTRQDLMEASQQYARRPAQTLTGQQAPTAPRQASSFPSVNRLTAISQGIRDLAQQQQNITTFSIYDPTRPSGGI
jgi:hypothetical protein